ncbi:MAG: hypothetical protein RSC24_13785 [Clostridium sp.]
MVDDSNLLEQNILVKSKSPSKIKSTSRLTKEVESGVLDSNEAEVPKKTIRDTFYGRINVSVKTMDIVITVLIIALLASIIIGLII